MAKTHWIFLFGNFVISCASLIMLIVSTTTMEWVRGNGATQDGRTASLEAHYGLFKGTQELHVFEVTSQYDLTMTCLFEHNICGLSCQISSEARIEEISSIMRGVVPQDCPITSSRSFQNKSIDFLLPRQEQSNQQFLNAGLWLSTIVFLGITILLSFLTTVQSLVNILSNPIWSIFSVYGLYIWNGLSIIFTMLTLILWGVLFATSVRFNIAVRQTLIGNMSSDGLASLGFSFWILLGPIILHAVNIGLLLWRKWLIEREPPPVAINVAKNDFTILLY
ncbi:uncharacterized protein DMENIID0001_035480 [Sergentomyia squamirostris]